MMETRIKYRSGLWHVEAKNYYGRWRNVNGLAYKTEAAAQKAADELKEYYDHS